MFDSSLKSPPTSARDVYGDLLEISSDISSRCLKTSARDVGAASQRVHRTGLRRPDLTIRQAFHLRLYPSLLKLYPPPLSSILHGCT